MQIDWHESCSLLLLRAGISMRTNIRHSPTIPIPLDGDEPEQVTLLELVRAVSEVTDDEREVVAIQRTRVILRPSSGSLCSLTMFADEPSVATPVAAPRRATPAPATVRTSPEGLDPAALESGITQVSANQFTIERSLVNRLLTNQAALMRTARVIPHEEGGRVVGVKLYGIRRSSLLGRLGIQNGDMLRTINGYDMTAPDGTTRWRGESGGAVPSEKLIERLRSRGELRFASVIMGIGQGAVTWTPLHAANAYATLARGGVVRDPTLVRDGGPRR